MKTVIIILALVIVILLGVLIFLPATQSPSVPNETGSYPPAVSPNGAITVSTPNANDIITSPVTITGEDNNAIDGWFFEATFPVKVVDADGTVLGQGQAQAQPPEAWTSTGTIPFSATITFTAPHSATGTIVLSKDNPSGFAANDESFAVPIRFR